MPVRLFTELFSVIISLFLQLMSTDPRKLSIKDYTYDLPEDRIAGYPLEDRSASSLLVYRAGSITTDIFRQLPDYLPPGTRMFFNNTRVIHARLRFREANGAQIECFCLEPADGSAAERAFASTGRVEWLCMVGNQRKWKNEKLNLHFNGAKGECTLTVQRKERRGRDFVLSFDWNVSAYRFSEVLELVGELPIPPYLRRDTEESDKLRYNTVYASESGSVAAPTAGLHFTDEVLSRLKSAGIHKTDITLHVGAGTFRQVDSDTMSGHDMHSEEFIVSKTAILGLKESLGKAPVIAVGTTSLRVLESLYWFGLQLACSGALVRNCIIGQWEPYESGYPNLPVHEALEAVINWMNARSLENLSGHTRLMVAPGYHFRIIDGLVTNFHQPGSTLLLLVAALIGEDWRKVYRHALDNGFRFLSYGDSSLLLRS